MSTEPSTYMGGPTEAAIIVPTPVTIEGAAESQNAVIVAVSKANVPQRTIATTPSWNHIEPAIGKPGWVVSLGILAVLSTLLVGLWMERRSAERRVDSPADVPELRSYLTGELGR
jgi:hypothetical protein